MLKFILVLLGLALGQNNASTSGNNDNGQSTTQLADPGDGLDPDGPGSGGPVGGNTGQTPPPFTQL
jgi:hypothetical protein